METHSPDVLQQVLEEIDRLTSFLKKTRSPQVRSSDERVTIQAHALAWFKIYRSKLETSHPLFIEINNGYANLLEYSERATSRSTYLVILKKLKNNLIKFRSEILSAPLLTRDISTKPDFSALVSDDKMQAVLFRRWDEIQKCLQGEIPLAALIMMGSMLEALFLARVNKFQNFPTLLKLKAVPRDQKTGKKLPPSKWTLNNFIEIALEIGWIRKPTRDLSVVIRDYRNLIHPEKELQSGISVEIGDAKMFWSIFEQILEQVIKS